MRAYFLIINLSPRYTCSRQKSKTFQNYVSVLLSTKHLTTCSFLLLASRFLPRFSESISKVTAVGLLVLFMLYTILFGMWVFRVSGLIQYIKWAILTCAFCWEQDFTFGFIQRFQLMSMKKPNSFLEFIYSFVSIGTFSTACVHEMKTVTDSSLNVSFSQRLL